MSYMDFSHIHVFAVNNLGLNIYFQRSNSKCPEVVCFTDGESLLADEGDKDLVFLDVEMPGFNGIYIGNELKKKNNKIIIFVVTAFSEYNMQYWQSLLPHNCFFQTHRSFIVNFEHITDFDHSLIHLAENQFHAYLTRRKYSQFKEAYLLYLESMR